MFNLLKERWLPVLCNDGTMEAVCPTDIADPRYMELATPRADFDGAMTEFLIGLIQTACPPANSAEWNARLDDPMSRTELADHFGPIRHAFELMGDGPRFMQEFTAQLDKTNEINQLLADAPGGNTLKLNKDHFIKRTNGAGFGPPAVAMALYTRQTYEPGGGRGYRQGLRGAGPLTTIFLGESLWQTVWLNVLPRDTLLEPGTPLLPTDLGLLFPWMNETRTSENKLETTAVDVHPHHVFWGMPNRARVHFEDGDVCALTGEQTERVARQYATQSYGTNYTGAFRHPLSPTFQKGSDFSFRRGKELTGRARTYRPWFGVAVADATSHHRPALLIEETRGNRTRREALRMRQRIWCFGYEFKQASAVTWNETVVPLLAVDDETAQALEGVARQFIEAAESVLKSLRRGVQRALFQSYDTEKRKWKKSPVKLWSGTLGEQLEAAFWESGTATFFEAMEALAEGADRDEQRVRWARQLANTALQLFDDYCRSGDARASDPKTTALARDSLSWDVSLYNDKFRKPLSIPDPKKETA